MLRDNSSSADRHRYYAIIEDMQTDLLEGESARCDAGRCKDQSAELLGDHDIHQDDAPGVLPTAGGKTKPYALIPDGNRRLLEGTSIPLGIGGSDDLCNGLLGVPDTHQDDNPGFIPTGGAQSTPYAPVLEGNRGLLEWASVRQEAVGSDDLRNGLLGAPDIHRNDASGAFPTRGEQSMPYAILQEGDRRLLDGASIRWD